MNESLGIKIYKSLVSNYTKISIQVSEYLSCILNLLSALIYNQ